MKDIAPLKNNHVALRMSALQKKLMFILVSQQPNLTRGYIKFETFDFLNKIK